VDYLKGAETRKQHVERVVSELKDGIKAAPVVGLVVFTALDKSIQSFSGQYTLNKQRETLGLTCNVPSLYRRTHHQMT